MTTNTNRQIKKLFEKSGFNLNSTELKKFLMFYNLLIEYNDQFDLSRIKRFDDIIIKHFVDSIYIKKLVKLPSPIIDIGTGAGFPGIPLCVMDPHLKIILCEPRHRRVKFLKIAIEKLSLKNASVYPHKVTDKSFFEVNGVITRALEPADDTLTRVKHFMPANGQVILLKGPKADNDLQNLSDENQKEYDVASDIAYTIPETDYKRRLIIFNKLASKHKKTYKIFKDSKETMGTIITSTDNKKFKEFKKLTSMSGIKQYGKAIISGKKIITDLINDDSEYFARSSLIIFDGYIEDDNDFDKLITDFDKKGNLYILKKVLFNELDNYKTNKPLFIVHIPEITEWEENVEEGCNLVIPFQDPANVGAVIRSAVGFDIKNIILLKESANPFHPKSISASAGSVFKANFRKGPSIKDIYGIIEKNKLDFLLLDRGGADIHSYKFPRGFLLLPGLEGPGLQNMPKLNIISVPQSKNIESLNAAIATSIALYEWKKSTGN
ncbi:16S rRNA (guanine(527)-N(7))-methyltransferase RsmG [Spirochaetota bacterium]